MKIQCENCAIQHELDPPSWVVSSGRAFRFRCSSCGHSQSVQPVVDDAPEAAAPRSTPEESADPAPPLQASPTLSPPDEEPSAQPVEPSTAVTDQDAAVFLKQNGQIYMVRDWATLKRWIQERRVDRHDLVSEGGVRWEPIGSRADLLHHFDTPAAPASPSTPAPHGAAAPNPTQAGANPFPFGNETPFSGGPEASGAWHDDDTEGIPTGLPPLPTDAPDGPSPRSNPASSTFDLRLDEPAPPALLDDDFGNIPPRAPAPAEPPGPPAFVARPSPPPESPPALAAPRPARPTAPPAVPAPGDWDDLLVPDTSEVPRVAAPHVPVPEPKAAPPPREEELDFEAEWEVPRRSGKRSAVLYYGLAVATLVLGVMSVWWFLLAEPQSEAVAANGTHRGLDAVIATPAQPVEAPAPAAQPSEPVPPPPAPVPAPVAAPVVAPEPPPVPQPVAQPAPAPAPVKVAAAPKPQPSPAPPAPAPAPKAASVSSLVNQGWNDADTKPASAARAFEQALAQSPRNNEANYGYGYVLLEKLGKPDAARPHLCKALEGAPIDIDREVTGLLERHGLSCN